jgi:hypothetical protein
MGHPVDVRRMPSQYLKFGGKDLRREDWTHTKVRAKERADKYRAEGRNARIVSFNHRWFIYVSPKPSKSGGGRRKHYLEVIPREFVP